MSDPYEKRLVVFFDANIPDDLGEYIEDECPDCVVVILKGKDRRKKDIAILRQVEGEARSIYCRDFVFIVTADKKFRTSSEFGDSSIVCVIMVSDPNSDSARQHLSERFKKYFDRLASGKEDFRSGCVIKLPRLID